MVEFKRIKHADTGAFIKMREFLGHWVLIVVENVTERPSKFEAGKTETLATCKWADLTEGESTLRTVSFSNPHIVKHLQVGDVVVAKVGEQESSRPGFAKALVLLDTEPGAELTAMTERAEQILSGKQAQVQLGLFD